MKKILLSVMLLFVALCVFADIYTIGSGTSASATTPFYGLYDYTWSKIIYTQAEINAAGLTTGENIIGIGFYVGNTPANYLMEDLRVYARHTTQVIYETTDNTYPGIAGFLQVFAGNITFNGGGWHYFTFSTPFEWNASQNIEFLFECWDGSNPTGYPTFRYTTTSPEYRAVYKGQDGSFPGTLTGTRTYSRANIQLITPQTTPPQAAVALYPPNGGTLISPSAMLQWMSTDGFPDGYRLSLGTNNPPSNVVDNVDLDHDTFYNPDPDLLPSTTYYWKVTPYNQFGDAVDCPVWSFTTHGDATISVLPYLQHWDSVTAPNMPFDWIALLQTTATAAYIYTNTTTPYSAPNNLVMFNSTDLNGHLLLISPPLDPSIPVNTTRVRFQGRPGGSNYTVSVGVISD
ncbi:MAG: hypothetical protein Q8M66_03935, partial [Actinomycetota bacterium]|nr:hypothetical protein [Actinomycetota bacterium]